MQRSMLAVPNSRPSQSAGAWIFCRDSRKRIDSTAMKLASIGPTRQRSVNCRCCADVLRSPRAASGSGTRDGFMAACAAADEIAMFGGIDLQCHSCSLGDRRRNARCPAGALRGAERGIACRADHRVVIDLATHHHRLAPPEAGHPRLLAGRPRRRLAGCLGIRCLGGRRAAVRAAVRVDFAAVLGVPVLLPLVTAADTDRRSMADANCSSSSASPSRPGIVRPRPVATSVPPALPGSNPGAARGPCYSTDLLLEMRHIASQNPSFAAPQTNSWGAREKAY